MDKLQELAAEFQSVVAKRSKILDSIFPPLAFVLVNRFLVLEIAAGIALLIALSLTALRLFRKQSWGYAFGGVAGVLVAALAVVVSGAAQSYFLPSIFTGALTAILCLVSIIANRPLVAFTSHLARGWPLAWYWHPKVSPAYKEVTWMWAIFFAGRSFVQYSLFNNPGSFWAAINLALGWPALILLLAGSYLYGTWRLTRLQGPGVDEFAEDAPPPWSGQQRGF
jgi:hypothetical protein